MTHAMRHAVVLFTLGLATGCAVRYPKVIPIREEQFRSHDQPVALPLSAAGSGEVARFLELGGNRFGRNPVPDAQAAGHKQALEALAVAANLTIRADIASSDFCAIAAALCNAAPIFRKRIVSTQIIDARRRGPEVPEPIGVCDDEYCWVFRQANQRFTDVVVVRSTQRVKP